MTARKPIELAQNVWGPTVPAAIRAHSTRSTEAFTFLKPDGLERTYTFAELHAEMNRRGRALQQSGLHKGDRLAFILPEGEDFVLWFLAAIAVGIVPVPIYPPLSFGKLDAYIAAAARILDSAQAKALLTDRRSQSVLWSLIDRADALHAVLTSEGVGKLAKQTSGWVDIDHIRPNDLAFLQFTSGSTAAPKGVKVTHGSLTANMLAIMRDGLQVTPQDRGVSWLPLYHDMGLIGFMLAPVWYGVPIYNIPTMTFIKHPGIWLQSIHRTRATISFAPNFAFALARRRTPPQSVAQLDLRCLKALGCGAEPNHADNLRAFARHFAPAGLRPEALLPCYGLAEATLAVTMSPLDAPLKTDSIDGELYHAKGFAKPLGAGPQTLELVSCGRPLPGHEIAIVDANGQALSDRSVGEIVVRGPSITAGYYGQPQASDMVFTPHGLHTGDLGYTADGELYVTGRKKDLIILHGRNYDPQTIEWAASEVDGVRRGNVVALSRPSDASEELVVVAEVKKADTTGIAAQIGRQVYESLSIHVADVVLLQPGQLPKTSSGKLQRHLTRQQYLDGTLHRNGVRTLGAKGDALILAKHVGRSMVSRMRHMLRRWSQSSSPHGRAR